MKSSILISLIFAFVSNLPGQGKVAEENGKLIHDGQLDKAEERVNFCLKADSNN